MYSIFFFSAISFFLHWSIKFFIYLHICSSQIVFLSNFRCVITTQSVKCFLLLSYPITPAINTFLDISSIFLHIFIQTGSLNKISCILFRISPRIFIHRTLRPLHQSVNLLSKPVFSLLFCQIFPFHLFCNNHTSKPIILIATYTMIYSFLKMSTQRIISSF